MKNLDGVSDYELEYQRKINIILEENISLKGFYAFMMNDKSISTVYVYLKYINNFMKCIHKPVTELNVDDFSGYMLKIQKGQNGTRTTSSYRIAVYSALNMYGRYLKSRHYLSENPMEDMQRPRAIESSKTIEKREKAYLTTNEIKTYMANVTEGIGNDESIARQLEWRERDLAIITIFLNTGIRCSALVKLDIDNIDFEKKILSVVDKESKYNIYEISDDVLDVIKKWLRKRNEMIPGSDVKALFISNRKTRISRSSVQRLVEKYGANIQGKHMSPHKLRATYGTQLYNATGDIYFVQHCLKHNSPKTSELYVRGNKNTQTKKASEIMGKLISDH